MNFASYLSKWKDRYRENGPIAIKRMVMEPCVRLPAKVDAIDRFGTNVLAKDWDILVILDGCRLDMYREVVNPECGWIWSVGSMSEEWMNRTFQRDISDLAYITGNPYSYTLYDEDPEDTPFTVFDEVWKHSWDDDLGVTPPEKINDVAINTWRTTDVERMIVHHMQPHFPFIGGDDSSYKINPNAMEEGRDQVNPWEDIKHGKVSYADIKDDYYSTLEYVWRRMDTLMNNVNGDVVFTADHGNDNGRFGVWGHRRGTVSPDVRMVPWDRYECKDLGTHSPDIDRETVDDDVKSRLKELGYHE